ncbi:hypothetical protein TCA2_4292 [Paenibacillus sp. TCA20]|nr:hypothetical protein TCA2_4292 [Paenibacillus sp. TCA20]
MVQIPLKELYISKTNYINLAHYKEEINYLTIDILRLKKGRGRRQKHRTFMARAPFLLTNQAGSSTLNSSFPYKGPSQFP